MYSPLCGAWIACEAYRHGKASGDDLSDVIEKSALFILDYLTSDNGVLTVIPSVSPETRFACGGGTSSGGTGVAVGLFGSRPTL